MDYRARHRNKGFRDSIQRHPHTRHDLDTIANCMPDCCATGWGHCAAPPNPPELPRDIDYDRPIPSRVDLRDEKYAKYFPPIWRQEGLNSCVAASIGTAYTYICRRTSKKRRHFTPSRLFIYWNERHIGGRGVHRDNGAFIRDGMVGIQQRGVCTEETWPYVPDRYLTVPSTQAYEEAMQERGCVFELVGSGYNDLNAMRQTLADKLPVIFGFLVPHSFDVLPSSKIYKTGILEEPLSEADKKGGHAILAVGYDDDREIIICRNSWGEDWGKKGHFYMPYSYFTKWYRCLNLYCIPKVVSDDQWEAARPRRRWGGCSGVPDAPREQRTPLSETRMQELRQTKQEHHRAHHMHPSTPGHLSQRGHRLRGSTSSHSDYGSEYSDPTLSATEDSSYDDY